MDILKDVLLFLHLIFLAALIGGYFVAATQGGRVNTVLQWGARLQLIVGVALYGVVIMIASDLGAEPDHMMLGIKGLIGLAVVALVEVAAAAQSRAGGNGAVPRAALVHVAGVLAILNVALGMVAAG